MARRAIRKPKRREMQLDENEPAYGISLWYGNDSGVRFHPEGVRE